MKLARVLFSFMLALCVCFATTEKVKAADRDNCINVTASASMEVAPDMAYVLFTADGSGVSADLAAKEVSTKMDNVRRALLGLGILSNDIITQNYNTSAIYDTKGKVTGYKAENHIKVTVNDISKVGNVIDKITSAGINQLRGVTFTVKNKELYKNKLLAEAVANARNQANVVANAGGRSLGTLVSASFNSYTPIEKNVMRAVKMAADTSVAPTVIEAGTINISVTVQTTFSMKWNQ